jgi:hypothetical protein
MLWRGVGVVATASPPLVFTASMYDMLPKIDWPQMGGVENQAIYVKTNKGREYMQANKASTPDARCWAAIGCRAGLSTVHSQITGQQMGPL